LPEPAKQHEVYDSRGRLATRADFAYVSPKRILIYADGLEFHIWSRVAVWKVFGRPDQTGELDRARHSKPVWLKFHGWRAISLSARRQPMTQW
jgi:hypothetical protein